MDSFYLDMRTLNFVVILFSVICFIGLIGYQYTQNRVQGLTAFALSLLFIGMGPLLLAMRDEAPDWLTVVAANSIIFIGFTLTLYGISLFKQFPLKYAYLVSGIVPLAVGMYIYFTYYAPSIKVRIIISSVFLSIVTLCSATALIKGQREDLNLPNWMMATSFAMYSLFMAFRCLWSLHEPELSSFMTAGLVHQLTFLFSIILVVAISFSMLWLINARLVKSIHHLSYQDALTCMYNRRAMETMLPEALNKAKKRKRPTGIIMSDIDNFKTINDQHGHTIGDSVIRTVASIFQSNLPRSSYAVRFGGDEFMVLLPNKTLHQSRLYAEKLRESVEKELSLQNSPVDTTMSFGVSEMGQDDNFHTLVARADLALYRSKHSGRNKVTVIEKSNEDNWCKPACNELKL
ncbi:GGDEF domain-containing protein [Vibrio sp. CAU 1672]|uniref:GGDEF domain-containing protein n=1 Tax=Vibrio sp. CAU 1672 TaxID=3032594 RepID=UPI0023DC1E6E|nr:GGDEF domain-containing protein [Vibrio sp. CAU 1672]MDF2152548.1 GGDEF domain-containing protein [Vibrio sp. CAU 1672]